MSGPKFDPPFDERRLELIRLGREVNRKAGIPDDLEGTVEDLHAMQRARGIRPEDNIGARELMRMRYGDDPE